MNNDEYPASRFLVNATFVALGGALLAVGLTVPKLEAVGVVGGFVIGLTFFNNSKIMDMPLGLNHQNDK